MSNKPFELTGQVEIFPGPGGWHYIAVPQEHTELTKPLADRGLVAIRAKVGAFEWDTSLLPKGDGTTFIALPKKCRDAEKISLGDNVKASFTLRSR